MENHSINVVVLIPAYNPNEKLIDFVKSIIELNLTEILVINDGSKPECDKYFKEIAKCKECHVINHYVNQGKGRALKTGFNYYLENYDCDKYVGVVTADADGQHTAKDTLIVAKSLFNNQKCLVLGKRNFNQKNVPIKSKFGNKITTQVFKMLYGIKINDTQTGLRGINSADLKKFLKLNGEKFDFEINMLIEGTKVKANEYFLEESIETVYEDNNKETHFNPIFDSVKIYMIMFKKFFAFAASGIVSSIIDITLFSLLSFYLLNLNWISTIFYSALFFQDLFLLCLTFQLIRMSFLNQIKKI
ncbi:MAG: glycosyltransferase family 2 protein [Erysipelotrichaceae bacterium]